MIITDKASKFKRKIAEHSTESWVFKYLSWSIPIILVISIICMIFVPQANKLVTYPEQVYSNLEQQAEEYLDNFKSTTQISNIRDYEFKFEDTSTKCLGTFPVVTLTITDYGKEDESFKITRTDIIYTHILAIATMSILLSLLLSFAIWGIYIGSLWILYKIAIRKEKITSE